MREREGSREILFLSLLFPSLPFSLHCLGDWVGATSYLSLGWYWAQVHEKRKMRVGRKSLVVYKNLESAGDL